MINLGLRKKVSEVALSSLKKENIQFLKPEDWVHMPILEETAKSRSSLQHNFLEY